MLVDEERVFEAMDFEAANERIKQLGTEDLPIIVILKICTRVSEDISINMMLFYGTYGLGLNSRDSQVVHFRLKPSIRTAATVIHRDKTL